MKRTLEAPICSTGKWGGHDVGGVSFTRDAKRFKRDLDRIDKRMRFSGKGAEHAMAVQIAKDTEPYVPARTKSLANRTIVADDAVIYPGPYARFLYNGKLMIDPKTGSPFAQKGASKEVVPSKDLNISTAVHSKAQSHWFEASKAQNLDKWKRVAGRVMQREFRG